MQSAGEHKGDNRFLGEGTNRSFYLPRLSREFYEGDAVVHWTMPIALRGTGWLDDMFHARFREIMLHAATTFIWSGWGCGLIPTSGTP